MIASSGYQFIEPTSELFAATLFNLFLVAAYRNWNPVLSSGLLAGFGLCKVELLLAAIVIAGYWYSWASRNRKRAKVIAISFAWWLLIFLLPGFVIHGTEAILGNRSLISFNAHYNMLFSAHQFSTDWQKTISEDKPSVSTLFDGAKSVGQIVLQHPRQYLDFLALSAVESIINVGLTLKVLTIPFIALLWHRKWPAELRFPLIVLTLALVFTLLPAWFFGFVHVRYLSRYFPAIVVMITAGCLESTAASATKIQILLWVSGIATTVWQINSISMIIKNAHFL